MTIDRRMIEEYLDGEMSPRDMAQVDQALQSDAGAQRMLRRLSVERAARRQALAGYEPTRDETLSCLASFEDKCDRDVVAGRIGPVALWSRRIGAVAAVAALMISAYSMGRVGQSATAAGKSGSETLKATQVAAGNTLASGFVVQVVDADGQVSTREFATMQEARKYADDLSKRYQQGLASADASSGMF